MIRSKSWGVDEGNAIENIVAYGMRREKGIATEKDRRMRDEGYKTLNRTRRSTHASGGGGISSKLADRSQSMPPSRLWSALIYAGSGVILFFTIYFLFSVLVHAAQGMVMARP